MSDDSVRVAVRVRPLVSSEKEKGCQTCISPTPGQPQLQVIGTEKAFTFDYVFGSDVGQDEVYNNAVKSLVTNIFNGYNVTILAYGQTGSGKTYSMGTNYTKGEPMGVIPRAVSDIFEKIQTTNNRHFKVTVAFIELYQEQVYDLLSGKSRKESALEIREEYSKGIKIAGLTEKEVNNVDETFEFLSQGSLGRSTGATNMNTQSSRSHAIFTITVSQQKGDDTNTAMTSKFQLVDLAGSERSKKTGATGERFKEGVTINKGLLSLGNVISALGEGGGSTYIGYRDSKLTRLLQDSLGGNSITLMIACVSPADYNLEETLNTLRYADRAKKIKNKPIVNQDPRAAEINRLKNLVKDLQLSALGRGSGILSCPPEHADLADKNRTLQKKLRELTEQLHANLVETMCMHERAEVAEEAKSKMDQGLHHILGEFKNCLAIEDIDVDLRARLQNIHDKVLELQNNQKKTDAEIIQQISTEQLSPHRKSSTLNMTDEGDDSINLSEEGIHLDEEQAEHTLRQAERNHEVQNINRALALKEELVSRLLTNASHMAESKELIEMENEIKTLQAEKEQLQKALEETQANNISAKLSETRRKKLQELEKKISELNRKCIEQGRIIKSKEKTDQQLKTLSNEILNLKQTRVKLIREMRKETEKFSQWKQQRERELLRLKDQDRKRQNQMVRLQSLHNKQQNVFKRKMEEASAINKRLKDAFEKQKTAALNRKEKTKSKESIKLWVNQELDVLLGTSDAQCSLEKLMKDRTVFVEQIEALKIQHDKKPSQKLQTEINDLQTYVDLRNTQISELQNQIVESDQANRVQTRLETIQTINDARLVIKELFQSISGVQKKYFQKKSDCDELMEKLEVLTPELTNSYELDMLRNKIEELTQENESLKKEVIENCPPVKQAIQKRKTTSFTKEKNYLDFPILDSESEVSFIDDPDKDPDWRGGTPHAKRLSKMSMEKTIAHNKIARASVSTRLAVKRSSGGQSTCSCAAQCASNYCNCRRDRSVCSDQCDCDPEKCQNKDPEDASKGFFSENSSNTKRVKLESD